MGGLGEIQKHREHAVRKATTHTPESILRSQGTSKLGGLGDVDLGGHEWAGELDRKESHKIQKKDIPSLRARNYPSH